MATSPEEFSRWLQEPEEGAHLEFKEAKNSYSFDELLEYCVALGNEGGGHFVLGVSDKLPRMVVGTKAFPNPAKVATDIFAKLKFRVDVEELNHPDGRVLVFHIPGRPRGTAYHLSGKYVMRSQHQLVAMTEDRLRTIFAEGKPDFLSEFSRCGVTAADVVALLDTQSFFDLFHLPYPASRDAVLDRLAREKVISQAANNWDITNLGAVLFAKRLDDFPNISRKAPRVVVYDGQNKLKTRLDKVGTKGYAVGFEGLVEFINGQIPTNEVIEAALRAQIKMFPDTAIRELVANALIHQDFNETGTSVMIELYSDRLEISNPGQPFIPPERFIDEYQSRNERLADIMRRIGVCEEKGSGIDKVVGAAEAYQLPAPDFRVSERRTTVVMFAHIPFDDMDRNDRIRACYQHCCLRYVTNQRMTNQSLRERFHLPEAKSETASRVIRDTLDAGGIKVEDLSSTSKRYAKYVPFWA